jgi:hypothetical protein
MAQAQGHQHRAQDIKKRRAKVKLQRVQELELELKFVQTPQAATQGSPSSPEPTLSLTSRCSVSEQPTPPSFTQKYSSHKTKLNAAYTQAVRTPPVQKLEGDRSQ